MKTEISDVKWLRGGLYGAVGYVTALLFTGLWFYFDHYNTAIRALATTRQRIGMGVGTFYEGQFVVGNQQFFFKYARGRDFLTVPMYRLIPVVVLLLVAGAFVYTEADPKDRLGALLSGSSLATGYVVLSLVVVLVFRSLAGSGFIPLGIAVVSGVLYPVVFGGIGGVAAHELKGYVEERASAPGVEENM